MSRITWKSYQIVLRVTAMSCVLFASMASTPAKAAGSLTGCAIGLTFCSNPLFSATNYCSDRWIECSSEQGERQKEIYFSLAMAQAERWTENHPYDPSNYYDGCWIP